MIDVPAEPLSRGNDGRALERARVLARVTTARFDRRLEAPQLHAQERSLELVDAEVAADLAVEVLRRRAVYAEPPHAIGERVVVRRDEPGIADRAEVLGGKEREARR